MNNRGYTLLELAVTTALFATIAGWSAVGMGRVVSEFRLHAASESLLGAAGLARSMAISRNTDIRLLVDPSSARFSLGRPDREPATWTPLPPGVGFVAVPSRPITFHNRGRRRRPAPSALQTKREPYESLWRSREESDGLGNEHPPETGRS